MLRIRFVGTYSRLRGASRGWWRGGLLLGLSLLMVCAALAKEGMDRDTRLALIRGLLREVGVSKVPMPRGKRGLRLDGQGKLDQEKAAEELRFNGMAIKPGMPVTITKIIFKADDLTFEFNGGGKSGKKWYQHIEIGMGTTTAPIGDQEPPPLAFGSSATLAFGKPLPNLSVSDVKKLLSNILDFERHSPTELYSPAVPPKFKDAIKNHQVVVGMDRDAVLSAKGPPDRRVRETNKNGSEQENWIYGTPPHILYVTFDGDQVVAVKQY